MPHLLVRYIVFPAHSLNNKPKLTSLVSDLEIISGPTLSGLYIVDISTNDLEKIKSAIIPYYLLMEDFESKVLH